MRGTVDTISNNSTSREPLAPKNSRTSPAHTVLFYEDDSDLLDTLTQSVCAAVAAGNSAIVVATAAHHDGLFTRLKSCCSTEAYAAIMEARLFLLDAEETISRCMVDGQPDPARFADVLGDHIMHLAANVRGENPSIFVFGEVAPLLWERGMYDAALRIEQLGNQLLASFPTNILCAYPARLFADGPRLRSAAEICALHSCVIPSGKIVPDLSPQGSDPAVFR